MSGFPGIFSSVVTRPGWTVNAEKALREASHFLEISLRALVAGSAAAARPPRPGDRGADGEDTERVGIAHLRRDEEEGYESRSLARNYLTTSFLFIHFAGGAEH